MAGPGAEHAERPGLAPAHSLPDDGAHMLAALLGAAFERSSLPMVLFGPGYARLRVNAARCALTGHTEAELLACGPLDTIHPDDRPPFVTGMEQLDTGGDVPSSIECRLLHRDGHWLWVRETATIIRDTEGVAQYLVLVIEDISEQRRAAESLRIMARASALLASSLDYDQTLARIAPVLVASLGTWCQIYLRDAQGAIYAAGGMHADPERIPLLRTFDNVIPSDPRRRNGVSWVIATGEPAFVPVVEDDQFRRAFPEAEHRAIITALGFRSWMCVPLMVSGQSIGALGLARGEGEPPYTEDDLQLAEELARRAVVAVEHARLYAAEQRARQAAERAAGRVTRLQSVTAALSAARTRAATLETVMHQAMAEMGAHRASVALVTADGAAIESAAGIGYPPSVGTQWRQLVQTVATPAGDVIRSGKAIFAASRAERDAAYPHLAGYESGNEAFVELPLIVEGRNLGTLSLGFARPRTFDDEDRDFMLALAGQCAQALDRARLHEQQAAAAAALETDRLKTELLNTVTHELRTPLAVIKGYASALQQFGAELPEDERAQFLDEIMAAAGRQSELVENLLQLARLESGMLTIESAPVALPAMLAAALDECRRRHAGRRIALTLPPGDVLIETDARRLQQVLANLVDNAVKYSPAGGDVTVSLAAAADGGVTIAVTDQGIGIAPEDQQRVFDRFYRVESAATRDISGTGLGLAICRRLVTACGGAITLASRLGEGSTFTIHLPATLPAERRPAARSLPQG